MVLIYLKPARQPNGKSANFYSLISKRRIGKVHSASVTPYTEMLHDCGAFPDCTTLHPFMWPLLQKYHEFQVVPKPKAILHSCYHIQTDIILYASKARASSVLNSFFFFYQLQAWSPFVKHISSSTAGTWLQPASPPPCCFTKCYFKLHQIFFKTVSPSPKKLLHQPF